MVDNEFHALTRCYYCCDF